MKNKIFFYNFDVKTIFSLWIATLFGGLCAFFTQVIIAKNLGPANLGIFAAVLAFVTILSSFAGAGVEIYWAKIFGKEGWRALRWLPGSYKLIFCSITLVFLIVLAWSLLGPHDSFVSYLFLIMMLYIPGQLFSELIKAKLQLEESYTKFAIWQFGPHFARLVVILIISFVFADFFNLKLITYVYSIIGVSIFFISIIGLYEMYKGIFSLKGHKKKKSTPKLNQPSSFKVFKESWLYGLDGVFYLIFFQIDIIFLKYLSGSEETGIYNVAFLFIAAVYLLPNVIYQRFMIPKFHRWAYHNKNVFYKNYQKGNFLMLGAGILAMFGIWIIASWIIPLLFGREYYESILILTILALSIPFHFVCRSAGAVLITRNYIKLKTKNMGIAAVLNIILNLVLIPKYGAIGAAVATIISEIIFLTINLITIKKNVFV